MRPTIRDISPKKFYRLKGDRNSRACLARVFHEDSWDSRPAYQAFEHNGYIYTCERTKQRNFQVCFKKYPIGYAAKDRCLLVSYSCKGLL